jgi:sugar transferase EpsL
MGKKTSPRAGLMYGPLKRAMDLGAASLGLVATAPLTLPAAAAIYATMGRPVLFQQRRPGLHGEPFFILKFRTMRQVKPGEDMLGSDRDRITRVGRFLRSTSIDELPTLLNVLRGEMSLVGPRPLLMSYLERYTPAQRRRHDVKPGVTGWAQVNGRNTLSWEQKLAHDCWYVQNRSLMLDVKIVWMTVGKVLKREGISATGAATMNEFMGTTS